MDGVLLVFDSRTLPNLHALATVSAALPDKANRRSRMVPAFATLLLMLMMASVYYVTSLRGTDANSFPPASVTSAPAEAPVEPPAEAPVEAPAAIPEPSPEPAADTEKRETHPTTPPKPAVAPAGKKAVTQPASPKPEPKKEDSKVESVLKKTGKILKKPFKF
jgi:outer membrane biosynthesis protein TonB